MRNIIKYFILFVSFIYLNNCSTMNLEDYKNNEPKLILEDFFSGKTVARGVFEDRFGNIKKYFKVDIVGKWDGSTLILEENFVYNDGTKEFRKWTIKKDKAKSNKKPLQIPGNHFSMVYASFYASPPRLDWFNGARRSGWHGPYTCIITHA